MARKPDYFYRQSGAVPFRFGPSGLELLLVTSGGGKRWVIPKGIVDEGTSPAESAAREAWEEAGVEGELLPGERGRYSYGKWQGTCTVRVFLLRVERLLDDWPETHRRRRWESPAAAAALVEEEELRRILLDLPRLLAERGEG